MTAAIKRMLAEKAAVEARRGRGPDTTRFEKAEAALIAIIDKAATFIDVNVAPNEWRPSERLKVAYLMYATSDVTDGPEVGARIVERALEKARLRYKRGECPNPFLGPDGKKAAEAEAPAAENRNAVGMPCRNTGGTDKAPPC